MLDKPKQQYMCAWTLHRILSRWFRTEPLVLLKTKLKNDMVFELFQYRDSSLKMLPQRTEMFYILEQLMHGIFNV